MEIATDTRQLFEHLQPTETDLDGFKVTLVTGAHSEIPTIFSQLLSNYFSVSVITRLVLIAPSTSHMMF
jgi:hypothetical protein